MTPKEMLLDCLNYYAIPVTNESGTTIDIIKGYRIEIEVNGMYKLTDNGLVIAPFADLDELCRFIVNS